MRSPFFEACLLNSQRDTVLLFPLAVFAHKCCCGSHAELILKIVVRVKKHEKYYNGAEIPRARGIVLEVLCSDKSYTTVIQGQSLRVRGLKVLTP